MTHLTLNRQISSAPAPDQDRLAPGRAPLSRAERGAALLGAAAVAGFGGYGFAIGSPSTLGYLGTVLLIGAAIWWLRREALPGPLAFGLAVAAIATLAGGLIPVGANVLYNAHVGPAANGLGTHFLQYDHLAHGYVSFIVVFACWIMLAAPRANSGYRREMLILAVGTGLGLGGLNEMVEFIATLAHNGANAGGYWNTGWDLISNFIGAGLAGLVIAAKSKATAS